MPIELKGLDSRKRLFTKKIRAISFLATGTQALFQPNVGTRWLLVAAYFETPPNSVVGTVTTAPHLLIDNGVDSGSTGAPSPSGVTITGVNLVSDVALPTTAGVAKPLTLANPATILDENSQLRMKCGTAQIGGTQYTGNLVLEFLQISN
jgi:hypothetical protein